MAVVKQRGSKYWWISIYMGSGVPRKYLPSGTEDKGEAEALEKLVLATHKGNMSRKKFIAAVDALMGWNEEEGVPVAELYDTYLKTAPTVSEHTLKIRRLLCKDLVSWIHEERPVIKHLHEITPQTAIAFTDWMKEEKGGRGKTQNTRVGHLRTIFKRIYVRAGLITNPFDGIQNVPESDSLSGRAFTPREQKDIFEQCAKAGNDWLAVCTTAKYTGLRLKDIALLQWDQIADDYIDITPSKTKKHKIRVRVPLHSAVKKELRLLEQKESYVFPVLAGRYLDDNPDSCFTEEVLSHVDINREAAHITFHCWRHTFRTMMAAADVSKDIAMRLGGWTNETTAEMYNHFDDFSQLERAINSLK